MSHRVVSHGMSHRVVSHGMSHRVVSNGAGNHLNQSPRAQKTHSHSQMV